MTAQSFQIDTKGTCLMCISDCATETHVASTGFKMFLRYLKIDLVNLLHFSSSSSFLPNLNGPDSVEISVFLCESCALVINRFLQLFQQLEKVRMELDYNAWKLNKAIQEGQEDGNRVREYHKRLKYSETNHISPMDSLNASIAERVRTETLNKCAQRLASASPKVLISKCDAHPAFQKMLSGPSTHVTTENPDFEASFTVISGNSINQLHIKQEINDIMETCSTVPLISQAPNIPRRTEMLSADAKVKNEVPGASLSSPVIYSAEPGSSASDNIPFLMNMSFDKGHTDSDTDVPTNDPLEADSDPEIITPENSMLPIESSHIRFDMEFDPKVVSATQSKRHRCKYCGKIFARKIGIDRHMTNIHTFTMFSKSFPPGTTEDEFNDVVEGLIGNVKYISKKAGVTNGTSFDFNCEVCKKIVKVKEQNRKAHLVHSHMDLIIANLVKGGNFSGNRPNTTSNHPLVPEPDTKAKPGPEDFYLKLPNGRVKCVQCRKILQNLHSFSQHKSEFHSGVGEFFRCAHCGSMFRRKRNHDLHMRIAHTFIMFSNRIPPGTTEDEVKKAIDWENIKDIWKARTGVKSGNGLADSCKLCGRVVHGEKDQRYHVLRSHMDHIIANLKNIKQTGKNCGEMTNVQQ